ncbi:hypothetical protein D6D01_02193 [Aureobasidium pullulans]|uniref:Uncharacterized protein n=1 Tax=Aureobasidium pullulans TaxID=5580 RepID=A0A4V4JXJ3_AURPU|nr:hypothetical protein D6D01_02193 [Aureobasidium pullulans]
MAAPKTEPPTVPRDHHRELVSVSLDRRGVQGPERPPDLPRQQRIKTDGAQSGQPDRNKEPRGSGKKPTRWLNFNNALNKLVPGAKFLQYDSGLYALAIGMGACPDWTSTIDWSGKSLENNAFSRLVEAAQSLRANSPRPSLNLEIMRVDYGTLSARYLATLINEYNKSPHGRKIQVFLAGRDVEKMTTDIRDGKRIVVRKNFHTQQWEGHGYAESASVGSYVNNHQAPALPIWSCPATEDKSNQADASNSNRTSCEMGSDYNIESDLEDPDLELLYTAGDDSQNGVHELVTCIAHDSRPSSSRFHLLYSRLNDHLNDSSYRGPSHLEPDGSLSGKALGALADWWNTRWKTYRRDKIILYTGNSYGRFEEVISPTNEVRMPVFLVYKDCRWHICISGHTLPFEYEVQEAEFTVSDGVNTPIESASELVHDLKSTDSNTEMIAEHTQDLVRVVERLEATSFEQTNNINGLMMAVKDLTATVATLAVAVYLKETSSASEVDHLTHRPGEDMVFADLISFDSLEILVRAGRWMATPGTIYALAMGIATDRGTTHPPEWMALSLENQSFDILKPYSNRLMFENTTTKFRV